MLKIQLTVQKVKLEKKPKLCVVTHTQCLVLIGNASFVLRWREEIKLEITVLEKLIVSNTAVF